jgi:hypothetical protein
MGNAYMGRLLAAAVHDSDLTTAFLRTAGLIDSPQSLMRPSLAVRVLRAPREATVPAAPGPDQAIAA